MANEVNAATIANLRQTLFQKRIEAVFMKELKHQEWAFQRKLVNTNSTRFLRVEKIAKPTTDVTGSAEGVDPANTGLSTNYLECTLEQYKLKVTLTDIAMHDIITGDLLKLAADRVAQAMAEGADYRVAKCLAQQSTRIRVGLASTHRVTGTATSGSTTTLVDSAIAGAYDDDFFNGGSINIHSGTNKAISRLITDFVGSTGTFTVSAFPQAIDTTSVYTAHSIAGIDGTFKLDTNTILTMVAIAQSRGMKPINGKFKWIVDAFSHKDIFDDATLQLKSMNTPNSRWENYSLGSWGMSDFVYTDGPYTENTTGGEDESAGTIIPIPMVGREAYSIASINAGKGKAAIEAYIVDTPDSGNVTKSSAYVGSKMRFVPCVVNSENVMCAIAGFNRYY